MLSRELRARIGHPHEPYRPLSPHRTHIPPSPNGEFQPTPGRAKIGVFAGTDLAHEPAIARQLPFIGEIASPVIRDGFSEKMPARTIMWQWLGLDGQAKTGERA